MGKTVIGLDIGTSAIKTVAYSLENGVLLSERTEIPARISDGKTINPEELARIVISLLSKTV
ncbi:pilus assembly protein PilM, partial [Candidatus Woesearchaeota archaeon]|nr:pilus assembly protein PilM [Candidatus Woesearchaeota archaeon]